MVRYSVLTTIHQDTYLGNLPGSLDAKPPIRPDFHIYRAMIEPNH
jgi:hypothetical protein